MNRDRPEPRPVQPALCREDCRYSPNSAAPRCERCTRLKFSADWPTCKLRHSVLRTVQCSNRRAQTLPKLPFLDRRYRSRRKSGLRSATICRCANRLLYMDSTFMPFWVGKLKPRRWYCCQRPRHNLGPNHGCDGDCSGAISRTRKMEFMQGVTFIFRISATWLGSHRTARGGRRSWI